MSTVGGNSVGRTLARLAALAPKGGHDSEPQAPADSRHQILTLIADSATPVSVDHLCAATGLHPNTVRGHLEVLLAGGEVHRQSGARRGRGRPPWLYTTAPGDSAQFDELVMTLIEQLDSGTDPELVHSAAQRWAQVAEPVRPAESADEAVEDVVVALSKLGFSADVSPAGDTISLRTCPYLPIVEVQPIICDIHAALLAQLLEGARQDVHVVKTDVFPRPGVCVAHLQRPDVHPIRTIQPTRPGSAAPASATEEEQLDSPAAEREQRNS